MFVRRSVCRRLSREVQQLEAAGLTVIRIEPGDLALDAMGLNPMDPGRARRVAEAAYGEMAGWLTNDSPVEQYEHRSAR